MMGESEVYLRTSTDGGETFSSIKNLSNDVVESNIFILGPQIALKENDVYTIFERRDFYSSNLYLNVFSQSQVQQAGTLFLQTLNGRVDVILDMGEDSLALEGPSSFELKFLDPETAEPLENVNYSFTIEDLEGNEIVSNQNQRAESGMDIQKVQFSKTGPVTVIIDVEGIGDEQPYTTYWAGKTSAVITVVPEFPMGALVALVLVLGAVILLSKITSLNPLTKKISCS